MNDLEIDVKSQHELKQGRSDFGPWFSKLVN